MMFVPFVLRTFKPLVRVMLPPFVILRMWPRIVGITAQPRRIFGMIVWMSLDG
jgi:hypothetical protein